MSLVTTIVLVLLVVAAIAFLAVFIRDFITHKQELGHGSWVKSGSVGFVTNFLDVLGIGSFAPTTAGLRLFKQAEDRIIPGTLNISCTIPVIMEALLFIRGIEVEPVTLVGMLAAATVGAYLGARIVSKMPVQPIRLIMGVALFLAAFLMLASMMNWFPGGGEATGLTGVKLVVGIGLNFVLGMLMTAGIGLYAPCLALVSLLGMSPLMAFPIMMGSCAFLMPVASVKFIKEGVYARRSAMAITIGGAVGVLIAYYIVKSMPLTVLRWLVVGVLTYTSITLLGAFLKVKGFDMLNFVKKAFHGFIGAILWLNLILSTVAGGIAGNLLGGLIDYRMKGGFTALGVIIGLIIGLLTDIIMGGFIATILNIDANIEQLKLHITGSKTENKDKNNVI